MKEHKGRVFFIIYVDERGVKIATESLRAGYLPLILYFGYVIIWFSRKSRDMFSKHQKKDHSSILSWAGNMKYTSLLSRLL